jgi:hypothetical protein
MRNIIIFVLVVALLVLGAIAAKPDEASFDRYIVRASKAGEDASLLDEAAGTLKGAQAKLTADYRDHVLWATVEATRGTTTERYLGVFGMWLRLGTGPDR